MHSTFWLSGVLRASSIASAVLICAVLGATPAAGQPAEQPTFSGPPPLPPAVPRVVIAEIQAHPLLHDDRAGEFVEIVNLSRQPVRLTDLTLLLPSGVRAALVRPSSPLLHAGEVALATPMATQAGEVAVKGMRLPNDAGRLELFWRQTRVDVVQWHKKAPWPKAKPGASLERVGPDADASIGRSWRRSQQVWNGVERASPGRVDWPCEEVKDTALEGRCVPRDKRKTLRKCG